MRPGTANHGADAAVLTRGLQLHQAGKISEAQAAYRDVLHHSPQQADALHMLGVAEFQCGRLAEARRLITASLGVRPAHALARFNLGCVLRESGLLDEAGSAFAAVLQLEPGHADALKNLGNIYKETNRFDEAIGCYDQLLARGGKNPLVTGNKAIALLTIERFAEAWPLYEARLQCDSDDRPILGHSIPRQAPDWDGQKPGKPLLVVPEQGLGDQVFYGGMLAELEQAGIESYVCLDERLIPLFRRAFPGLDFATASQIGGLDPSLQLFGGQVAMGSLGRWLRNTPADFSRIRSPYLVCDGERSAQLRQRVARPGRLVCGLSWASRDNANAATKSCGLPALLPLLRTDGIDFIDLQYGDTAAERSALLEAEGIDVRRLADIDNKNDIDGLCALIQACDVVVSVSNTTAHLAAALGKPTLVLLASHTPLWYWHVDRMDSPWYPSAVLLRQQSAGDWSAPVAHATHILAGLRG